MPKLISRLRDKLFPKYRVKSWGKIFSVFNFEPYPSKKKDLHTTVAVTNLENAKFYLTHRYEHSDIHAKGSFVGAGDHFFKAKEFRRAAEAYSKAAESAYNAEYGRGEGYVQTRTSEVLTALEVAKLRAKAGEAHKKDGDRAKAAQQYELGARELEKVGSKPALEMYKQVYNTFYDVGDREALVRTKRKIAELEERIEYLENLPWNAPLEQWLRKPKGEKK